MSKLKKLTAMALSVVMVLGLLAGCGDETASSAASTSEAPAAESTAPAAESACTCRF